MIGKCLAAIVRVVNSPMRAVEIAVGYKPHDDRLLSLPGEALARAFEEIDK